jgi:hypothetical protein
VIHSGRLENTSLQLVRALHFGVNGDIVTRLLSSASSDVWEESDALVTDFLSNQVNSSQVIREQNQRKSFSDEGPLGCSYSWMITHSGWNDDTVEKAVQFVSRAKLKLLSRYTVSLLSRGWFRDMASSFFETQSTFLDRNDFFIFLLCSPLLTKQFLWLIYCCRTDSCTCILRLPRDLHRCSYLSCLDRSSCFLYHLKGTC